MKTSILHTLEAVLAEGIREDAGTAPIPVSCVFIPKIQRSYAQGRSSETEVRKEFLKSIFDTLTSENDEPLELSFLFGSKQMSVKKTGEGFELLDGQQRFTTLFLLYWYLSMKENRTVPAFLSKFTYETRDTSSQFLDNITSSDSRIDITTARPSEAVRSKKWFTDDFYCDPTVVAMLTMLDHIDAVYKARKCGGLYSRLNRLKFYVLMLEKFDMNDELYIKMNSRGLPLIPFENFKASLVKFMKSDKHKELYEVDMEIPGHTPFWFEFITKIDAEWIDIFWKYRVSAEDEADTCNDEIVIDDRLIGDHYLNFINRYLYTKAAIAEEITDKKTGPLTSFFYKEAESDAMKRRLFGWDRYEKAFCLYDDAEGLSRSILYRLARVFDAFRKYGDIIIADIEAAPYGNLSNFSPFGEIANYTLQKRVAFAAVTEFIEHIPDGEDFATPKIRENFHRMLRVVFNIIENTSIREVSAVQVIRAVSKIISAPGAVTGNFYKSLGTGNFKSDNRQLKEEIEKAREMFDADGEFDTAWEDAFIEAERHTFFKGSVRFFFTPGAGTSADFRNRYSLVGTLFDKNGISPDYRKEHILQRALVSCINNWNNGLRDTYLTENAESEKYLKNRIIGSERIRRLFCGYFEKPEDEGPRLTFKSYLEQIIDHAQPREGESRSFKRLFSRLTNDAASPALYDWINEREKAQRGYFIVKEGSGALYVNIPGKWYDRMMLDTERHLIVPRFVAEFGMEYADGNQKAMIKGPVKDAWGWNIELEKKIEGKTGTRTLRLKFKYDHWADFLIYGSDLDHIAEKFGASPGNIAPDNVRVAAMQYQLLEDIAPLEAKIRGLIAILETL